ncbi:MAG: Gfo/Idh/MocA family oxidoreductase [Planctomycetota bacterium]|nr:Gfo/Idh/MocA family oxidoreductase [Planctomycetota bacterium]
MVAASDKVRLGFVGVGNIARGGHLNHLAKWPDVELVSFCDVNKDAVAKTAAEFKARPYTQLKDMLAHEELDAVYVCVPPFAHDEAEIQVAEKKLALFVEKPLGTTLAQTEAINKAVLKAGVVSAVGYNWRSTGITRKARAVMEGRPVSAAYGFWTGNFPEVMWWRQQAQSGGQLNEQATHVVDIARYLIGGKVVSVYAQGAKGIMKKRYEKHDIHDNAIALLTFDHGCVCTVATGHTSAQGYRVGIDFILDDLTVTHNNGELRIKVPGSEEIIRNQNQPYEEEDRAFLQAVRSKDPQAVYCSYADGFETHRVTMAANTSMETGEVVKLG